MKYIISLMLVLLVSCRKEKFEFEANSICSNCLYGQWQLIYKANVIDNDTTEMIENGKLTEFWYGKRFYQYNCSLSLEIHEDYIIFDELIEDYYGEDYAVHYQDNWKWINSSFQKTHLYMPIKYREGGFTYLFRINKLTNEELKIESRIVSSGHSDYVLYYFKKIKSNLDKIENNEKRTLQKPSNIIGTWTLVEFMAKWSDDEFSVYKNDTLTMQFYQEYGLPPYIIKETIITPYILSITFSPYGDFSATDIMGTSSDIIVNFWYWTDENNLNNYSDFQETIESLDWTVGQKSHEFLNFPKTIELWIRPTIFYLTGYEIKRINKDLLELLPIYDEIMNDLSPPDVSYKFKRIN